MKSKSWLILLASLGVILLASSVGVTRASFLDLESSSDNTFEAWTSILWQQTTQPDFEAGVLNNVDTSSSPGDVKLAITSNWYNTNWQYRKKITIDHAKVDADLTDFPVLISLSADSDLAAHAQGDGDDILFTSSNGTTKLSHEIEKFDGSTGQLIAWVKVLSLSSTVNTEIYMYYGNATCGSQENITGVWASGWKTVCHMAETNGNEKDSVTNSLDYVKTGTVTSVAGKIGQARKSTSGDSNYFVKSEVEFPDFRPITVMAWVKFSSWLTGHGRIFSREPSGSGGLDWECGGSTNPPYSLRWWVGDSFDSTTALSLETWYFVATTYVNPTTTARIYINGVEDATGTMSDKTCSNPLYLFRSGKGTGRGMDGTIDEFGMYNGELSAGFIKTCYNNQNSPSTFYSVGDEEEFYVSLGTIASQVLDTAVPSANWYDTDWSYRERITVDHTKVDADLTDFPVFISLSSNSDLAAYAQGDGDDILFTSSNGTTKLSHEIEGFDNSTGKLIAWVKVPSLSGSTGTDIYMYYGNSSCGNQEDVTGVWDSNFKGVWHLNQTTGGADAILDSTSNNNDGTDNGNPTLGVTGQIGNAIDFNGSTDYMQVPSSNSLKLAGGLTIEAWINVDSWGNWKNIVFKGDNSASNTDYQFALVSNGLAWDGTLAGAWRTKYFNTSQDTGTWIYVVVTHDTSTVKCYRGGSEISSQSDAGAIYESDVVLGIAAVAYSGTSLLDGKVDEVRISDKARSADWIKTCYNNQNSPSSFYTLGLEDVSTRWDALFWDETLESNTAITFEVRASDNLFAKDAATPSWTPAGGTSPVTSGLPSGRYMQWRATLTTSDTSKTPTLREVRVYHY